MRMPAIVLVSGLSALALGCSVDVLHYGAKNLVYAPCSRINGAKECVKANVLAEESWRHFQTCNPGTNYSKDFADGYVFGFADYVEKGGPGIPPVVAPLRYRKVHYETPEGHQQIAEWFAGCRAGIAAAMASGYREYVVLPMSVPPPKPDPSTAWGNHPGMEVEPVLPIPRPAPVERVLPPAPTPMSPPAPVPAPVTAPAPVAAPVTAPFPMSSAPAPLAAPAPVPAPLTAPEAASVPLTAPVAPAPLPAPTRAPTPMTPPNLPPADAHRPAAEPVSPVAPVSGPRAYTWPPATPVFRTTPPPPVRTTMPPPWEEAKPATRTLADPSTEAQRLAAALRPVAPPEAPLGAESPVDTGVWMPTRGSVTRDVARDPLGAAEPRPIAVGQPVKGTVPPEAALRSEAPPPPSPTAADIVSHRGARWQN